MEKIVKQVRQHKGNNTLLVTVPKKSGIKAGDLVEIKRVE